MTKEEFENFQKDYKVSSLSLKRYLMGKGISSPQYYYWKKKYCNNAIKHSGKFINITSGIKEIAEFSEVVLEYPCGIKINFKKYPGSKTLLELIQN
ncbi:MAG: hypothetical protein IT267_00480 [Saprospiraceae bacterium]|nr:hypothetical protein [Saprospiraceae bacterium]